MSDHDAFLAAITSSPDDDTPRLVYADFLEENSELERAAFIRAQVELARLPPWHPFAVLCKWRKTDWQTGKPFRDQLPAVDGFNVEWHPQAFRRGFGWQLNVRSLYAWEHVEDRILGQEPVGEIHLWGRSTFDDWLRFASSAVIGQLRRVHFVTSPIEPLRALRDRPEAQGITDLYFERASGAGIPEVVEDLLRSPLGSVIHGMHFNVGYESLNELIEAFNLGEGKRLERLSFTTMGLTPDHVQRLRDGPVLHSLAELHLKGEPLGPLGVIDLVERLPASLQSLRLSQMGLQSSAFEAFSRTAQLTNLRMLDLSKNYQLKPRALKILSHSKNLAGLRVLNLQDCQIGDKGLRHLTLAKFWTNLVELVLLGNSFSMQGIKCLLDASVPADLTALVLDASQYGTEISNLLRQKYGERLVFSHS